MGKALIVKPYWVDFLLKGEKTLEIRGSHTQIRGTIGVVKSGTGLIYGTVEVVESVALDDKTYEERRSEHRVPAPFEDIPYRQVCGWKVQNPILFQTPRPYHHKQGCVIWVNVPDELIKPE